MLFNVHLCNHIILLQSGVGLRAQFCTLLEVWGGWELGCQLLTRNVSVTPRIEGSKYRWTWSTERKHRYASNVNGRERHSLCEWSDIHVWKKRVCDKKTTGGNLNKKNIYFFLFLPKAVFEHVYISTLPHSCTLVKQYKELTTKILSITFLILAFLTIHLGDHNVVNVLIILIVISQFLIKLLHLCLEDLLHGLLRESAHHLSRREIVIHSYKVTLMIHIKILLNISQEVPDIRLPCCLIVFMKSRSTSSVCTVVHTVFLTTTAVGTFNTLYFRQIHFEDLEGWSLVLIEKRISLLTDFIEHSFGKRGFSSIFLQNFEKCFCRSSSATYLLTEKEPFREWEIAHPR
jgi:hypothetical protein